MTDRPSGIVLAGGRSTRFGADKLAAPLGGRPLLHWPLGVLTGICREVVLVVGQQGIPPLPALGVPLRIVRDDEPGAGPLPALITGLQEAVGETAIVVAGDMPSLVPAVLEDLARRATAADTDAAVLVDDTTIRPLPAALRCATAIDVARRLRERGEDRLRAIFAELRVDRVPEAHWRTIDPAGATLLDVDTLEDLHRLRSSPSARD
jgi:molybdopterin-guanine dinucleotide biosynthesis protein A